jgi:hypothetical protein
MHILKRLIKQVCLLKNVSRHADIFYNLTVIHSVQTIQSWVSVFTHCIYVILHYGSILQCHNYMYGIYVTKLSTSLKQSAARETNSRSDNLEIPCLLWNKNSIKLFTRDRQYMTLAPDESGPYPHIHSFNITFSTIPQSFKWPITFTTSD